MTSSHNGDIMEEDDHIHYSNRSGWLRAAVLGANDGLVSTSALLMGVGAANSSRSQVRYSCAVCYRANYLHYIMYFEPCRSMPR
jgi:VIT family